MLMLNNENMTNRNEKKKSWQNINIKLHTCVCAVMGFKMRALCVGFPTANIITRVCGDSLSRPGAPTTFRLWFFGQAIATGDHEGLCGAKIPRLASLYLIILPRRTFVLHREHFDFETLHHVKTFFLLQISTWS